LHIDSVPFQPLLYRHRWNYGDKVVKGVKLDNRDQRQVGRQEPVEALDEEVKGK
jgi:hypothetical protein